MFAAKKTRVVSHLDSRVNGPLSPSDPDSLFLDRQKALEAAMNDINSSFGKGSVTRLGSLGGALVETFPSGCLPLDLALGGGLPKGRIVEIYGPESSGKTTLALHAIAEVQKLGGNAMLVDAEHAFDPSYSKALGVDVENLIVCQPDNGEMALEIISPVADRMCRSGAVDLICIDSVSALTPRAEIEGEIGMQQMGLQARLMSQALRKMSGNGEIGMQQMGLQARLMSQALRKMSGNASKAGCTLIFLNQIRYKIGVYYGNPEVTSGGIALKFFASVRLEIRPIGKIKSVKGDEDIGLKVRVRVQKSKVSRPYKQAEFEIIFGEGASKMGCILDCAEMMDIVLKKGSWYSYRDQSRWDGGGGVGTMVVVVTGCDDAQWLGMDRGTTVIGLVAVLGVWFGLKFTRNASLSDGSAKRERGSLAGRWWLGQGRDRALQYLRENLSLCDEIEKLVRSAMVDGTGQAITSYARQSTPLIEDDELLEELQ
ncbi:DNA repair protein RecA homolog 1, chloroplastic [Tanacetum coccineum]|uniref:DNA repair protein RecA homolog 1, chloroplastic n=1 Tax=Tanacetum coccineum TaxID=301880 RepID=A0ABQ5C5U7_9ASTR